jgi:hypothetical protein
MARIDASPEVPDRELPDRPSERANPLDVRLEVTAEARDKLEAALAAPDARDKWLRIFPQGIS